MPNCAQLQQHVLSWIQICLWGQYLCFSPTRIQRTQSEVVADKRLICSSALSAINASSRFVIHFSVRVTFLQRVLTDGSTFFSIFSCTFCSTFFSSVLRECFFTHFFQYFLEYFSEYSPARVLFLVLFRVLFWVISCESTFWSNFFSFLSLLSVQLLLPRLMSCLPSALVSLPNVTDTNVPLPISISTMMAAEYYKINSVPKHYKRNRRKRSTQLQPISNNPISYQ